MPPDELKSPKGKRSTELLYSCRLRADFVRQIGFSEVSLVIFLPLLIERQPIGSSEEKSMTPDVRPLVAGNWKMNGTRESLNELKAIAEGIVPLSEKIDALICPPATLLYVATALVTDSPLMIGAQDCHTAQSGAFTGDISASMIADCFGTHVIVGHSERRTLHG
jgi:hypothetical protein